VCFQSEAILIELLETFVKGLCVELCFHSSRLNIQNEITGVLRQMYVYYCEKLSNHLQSGCDILPVG
jgi:hypothetical protein